MTRYSTSRGLLYTAPPTTDRRSNSEDEATAAQDPAAPSAAPADD
ncbi:hypothetical protein [Haladaptatus sp. DYSN1]|nr:hypothetical protein [Haladaptatus sp. DYSN1]